MAPDWRADFVAFLRDMGQPPEGRPELDRIDPNGNYEPGNCRWASRREQVCNTSRTVWVEHDGTRMVLKDFAASVGLTYSLIQHRRKARGLVGREINGSALL